MANWATTNYAIEGKQEDIQEIVNLYNDFHTGKRDVAESGASKDWEGNIILALGMDVGDSYVRGFIQACTIIDGVLYMWAREAWGVTDFRHFLSSHYDDMHVYFVSEERDCDAYSTNDVDARYFPYKICAKYCIGNDEGVKDFRTMDSALKHFAEVLGVDHLTEEDVNEWNGEHENSDEYIYIYEYEIFD